MAIHLSPEFNNNDYDFQLLSSSGHNLPLSTLSKAALLEAKPLTEKDRPADYLNHIFSLKAKAEASQQFASRARSPCFGALLHVVGNFSASLIKACCELWSEIAPILVSLRYLILGK